MVLELQSSSDHESHLRQQIKSLEADSKEAR